MQAITQCLQLRVCHLFDLMRGVTALDVVAERPTFHGLAQNCGRSTRARILDRRAVCGIKFAIVVPTTRQVLQICI